MNFTNAFENKNFWTAAAAALLALSAAGYFFPSIGIIPAAAAFFLVPGAAIVSRLAGNRLSKIEFLVAAVVLSVLVSTHFSYWLSLAFGYSRETTTLATALLCATAFLISSKGKNKKQTLNGDEKNQGDKGASGGKALEAKAALAITAIFFLLLAGMYHNNFWVEREGMIVVGGWNWSDVFVHLPVALTINNGNFPPEMPFYAGEKLVYHYFSDFHSALVANYFGGSLQTVVEAMRWENSLLPPLFFLACFALARRATGKDSTALIAAVLVVFGGGFAYYNLFEKQAQTGAGLLELAGKSPFDNDGKFFQIPSVLGGYLLVQRPQMIGLPALAVVLLLLLAWKQSREEKLLLLAGLVAGLLAPFQYFAFATAMAAITIFLVFDFAEKKKIDFTNAASAFLPTIFSIPFAVEALTTTGQAGNIKPALGWLAPKTPLEFVAFYLLNFGVPFILALLALKHSKGGLRNKKEFIAIGAFCFLLPNVLSLSGTVWDMAKFFTYMSIAGGILAASSLEGKGRLLVAGALLLSLVTPLQMLYWTASSDWSAMGEVEVEAGEWMAGNTPQKSVFVTSTEHISPVDSVAGRLRVVGYAGWMNNFGLPYREREVLLPNAFCGNALQKREAIEKLGAKYLYSGPAERRIFQCDHSLGLKKMFSNSETAVYALQ